ncbi:MAG TPA: beta-propeller domain-containing protein [Polyangiaceae bacterium]|nr:beta-propeller domain-containing protein [Polyangiaceae bacterium]
MRLTTFWFGGQFLCLLPLVVAACGGEKVTGPESLPADGYFESSATGQAGPGFSSGGATASAGNPNGAPGDLATRDDTDGESPQRAIAEADIIQLAGSTLYAMSRSGGLSVIDVSKPAALKILGRYRTSFTPFEMYVKDGVVFAMYSDWGYFAMDEATQQMSWKQSSSLLALDVTTPASIKKLAQFDLPGEISDSRLVGNVLYAVSYQNGSCWRCASKPATNVVSIDVSQPSKPVKVDELAFDTDDNRNGWGKRSISVTTDRIYVAGPEYGQAQPENSTIQVVDISDPQGDLVAGTTVSIKGQITSRWQMDETDGVLRVISQPWTWWNNSVEPALETFRVTSSQKIDKLAHLDIKLPRPESLQSVRFDGPRGYAVTFERKDPLFTFDLTDPTAPKQMGELEMPGFLYHMEPRGNRLIGLGFDQGNPEGAITVSIFDVTNLATPTMIQRVNFGGDWAYLAEDQDRIHKLFKLDEQNGLMLVPFSGWKSNGAKSCGSALNGVQLIDWAGDSLALRGMAPSMGQARRAFMLKDTLFTVAEQEVAAFDLTDRDAPKQVSQAPLSLNVSLTLPTGDRLVRLRRDWYGADMRLEVVPRATPDALVATATFNLTDYLREKHGLQDCGYWYPSNEPLFSVGDTVWTLINDYGQWNYDGGVSKARSLLVGFSPETGVVTGSLALPFQPGYWGYSNTSRIVKGSTALLMQEGWDQTVNTRSLVALDLADPTAPRLAYSLALPTNEYYGSVGMLESGNELITSYAQTVPGKQNVVRHFALRLDVSEPLQPKLKGSYNVPGYVVDFDAAKDQIVTLDHQPTQTKDLDSQACYAQPSGRWFEQATGICHGYTSQLHRLVLASDGARVSQTLQNDELAWATPRRAQGRLFFTNNYYGYYAGGIADGFYGGWSWSSLDVTVVSSDTFAYSKIKAPGVWNSLPNGQSLILAPSAGQPLTVIDASDVKNPQLRQTQDTALGYTEHLSVAGDTVYLSQGDGGVQAMTLP